MRIDGDLLHLGSAFKMRKVWAGYYSMINDFFTNAERSVMYHVSASRYRDLAMFFVDILADQNNPFPKFHLQDDKIESAALDLLLAILSRIPMDSELTKYLQAKPIERGAGYFSNLEKRRDVALEIKGYIKKQECIIAEVSNLESDMAAPCDGEKNHSPSTQPENLTKKLPPFWIKVTRNWLPSWLEGS
ncbi:hypothetical protein GALMADRAFT_723689 [Galerina marginata CBS 339.88]|uniref:Uncharacterized protein n=1 Tax=Galerina marginata (strain CBS 339.88) TaxID=685588 RepID=A0A067SQK2_GALM3|nr:hypothetical protein GALMADRAFT_723689 [Galerina marginata CBS 339.88]